MTRRNHSTNGRSRRASIIAFVACALACPGSALAQAARVVSVQGTAVVERAGQPPRVLAAGDGVEQSDVINVAQKSHAMLEFRDKSRVTLRPSTVFRVDSYADSGPKPSMVLGLVKGGLRANTGDIAKSGPNAVRIQTGTAILGVRGTDFDARLCSNDCGTEDRARPAARAEQTAAARVIEMSGTVAAAEPNTPPRELAPGAAIHPREGIVTGPDSYAVVAFRDGSRVTLAQRSHLAIARFDYDARTPRKGQAHLRLVSGNAHVWTGDLAKIGPDAFLFETGAGTIRTQGAGFSVGGSAGAKAPPAQPAARLELQRGNALASTSHLTWASGLAWAGRDTVVDAGAGVIRTQAQQQAADEVLVIHTWDGSVILQTATERIELKTTDTVAIAIVGGKLTILPVPPASLLDKSLPLPNTVNVDPSTFGQQGADYEPGLYVWVREGVVVLGKDREAFEIKAGNAALATPDRLALLDAVPNFMRFDPTPRFPGGASTGFVPRAFKAPDGSISRTCR